MRRLFYGVSVLFVLAVYVGFVVPSTLESGAVQLQSSDVYTTYAQLTTPSAPLLAATNEVLQQTVAPTMSTSDDVDHRLVGMLLHIKWLLAKQSSTGGVSKELFDKQVQSLLDDDDDDSDGDSFENSTLTAPIFSGAIGSNLALGAYYLSGDGGDEGIFIDSAGAVQLTAALKDTSGDAGTNGYVLLSTGSGTNWVATSTLGISGSLSNNSVTPDYIALAGQTDEYCLTYESTGDTWEWQTCGSGSGGLATTSIDTSSELSAIIGDETGTGALVFAGSPNFTGTTTAANAYFSGNVGIGTTTLADKFTIENSDGTYLNYSDTGRLSLSDAYGGVDLGGGTSATTKAVLTYTPGTFNTGTRKVVDITTSGDISSGTNLRPLSISATMTGTDTTLNQTMNGVTVDLYNNLSDGRISASYGMSVGIRGTGSRNYATAAGYATIPIFTSTGGALVYQAFLSRSPSMTSSGVISSAYGVYLEAMAGAQVTNAYGIYQAGSSDVNYFAGNTGVGSTSPSARLTVRNTGSGRSFLVEDQSADTTPFVIDASGNVGIGTTTPYAKLSVVGDVALTGGLYDSGASRGSNGMVLLSTGTGVDWVATSTLGISSGGGSLFTDGGASTYLTALGDSLAIGTSTANEKLTVEGNINLSTAGAAIYFDDTRFLYASSTNHGLLFGELAGENITGSDLYNIAFGYQAGRNADSNYNVFVGTYAGSNSSGQHNYIFGYNAGYNNNGAANFIMGPDAGYNNFGGNNFIFGDDAGYNNTGTENFIFGTNAGYGSSGSSNLIMGANAGYSSTGNNNIFLGEEAGYNNGGSGNILLGYQAANNLTSGNHNIVIGYDIDSALATTSNTLNIGNLIFGTGLDGTGTTLSSGNIGIGSTTPSSKLTIQNTGSGNSFIVEDQAGDTTPFVIDAAGNVGIGTTTPNQLLTVQGNINLSAATGAIYFDDVKYFYASSTNDSIIFGENAGATFTSNTLSNVAFGEEAGRYASTSNADNNNYIGFWAGRSNEGSENNIMGYFAGASNTGFATNLFGQEAGYNNSGGNTNIIGYSAGYNNTGAGNNIMGISAGYDNTGAGNNMFGENSGYNNTGDYNNLFGAAAGINNTGDYNNIIGYSAGYYNPGDFNDLIGYRAGRYLHSTTTVALGAESLYGSHATQYISLNNVALGYRAGYASNDGSGNNIFLGYQAADNLTTGSNNIIIGYDIDAISATASNRLNIGNLIFGTGLDGTGTTLSSGNIGIGSTSPSSKLTIQNTGSGNSFIVEDQAGDTSPFVVDASGNVGVGTTTTLAKFQVYSNTVQDSFVIRSNDSSEWKIDRYSVLSNSGNMYLGYDANVSQWAFGNYYDTYITSGSGGGSGNVLIMPNSGNVGIGTTTPAQKLQVFGNIRVGTAGGNGCLEDFAGALIAGTCSSDENLKKDIAPIAQEGRSYLESLAALTPVTYTWNQTASDLYSKDVDFENLGLIAQDVEDQFPELVSLNDEGYRQVNFSAFPFYIIEALKEVWAKIQGHDERIENLEQENEYLKNRLDEIEDELNIDAPNPPQSEPVPEPPAGPAPEPEPVPEPTPEPPSEPVLESTM